MFRCCPLKTSHPRGRQILYHCVPHVSSSPVFFLIQKKKKKSFPRPTSQESPEDVRNEWIQPLGEQATVNGGRGPRIWTYECQSVWKKLHTPPTAYSVNLTSPGPTHLTSAAKCYSHFFINWNIHCLEKSEEYLTCSVWPLGHWAIGSLWSKPWEVGFMICS